MLDCNRGATVYSLSFPTVGHFPKHMHLLEERVRENVGAEAGEGERERKRLGEQTSIAECK